jgi:hypothetical protein
MAAHGYPITDLRDRYVSSRAICDRSRYEGSVGIHTIYFCELLRVTVGVNFAAMRGYVRP